MHDKLCLTGALAGVAGAAHPRERCMSLTRSYTTLFFSLSFQSSTCSFSLNCVNGKVSCPSSAIRSMIILAEDGEGSRSFRFHPTLTRLGRLLYIFHELLPTIHRISADILGIDR